MYLKAPKVSQDALSHRISQIHRWPMQNEKCEMGRRRQISAFYEPHAKGQNVLGRQLAS